jgi:hypothetical protein
MSEDRTTAYDGSDDSGICLSIGRAKSREGSVSAVASTAYGDLCEDLSRHAFLEPHALGRDWLSGADRAARRNNALAVRPDHRCGSELAAHREGPLAAQVDWGFWRDSAQRKYSSRTEQAYEGWVCWEAAR